MILRASRDLFEERGYDQVSTRDIAGRAGVTQALLFRHFGTKANLFVSAVYQPFYDLVTEYIRRWADQGHGGDTSEHDTEVFVTGLYQILLDNRKLLVTLTDQASRRADDPVRGRPVRSRRNHPEPARAGPPRPRSRRRTERHGHATRRRGLTHHVHGHASGREHIPAYLRGEKVEPGDPGAQRRIPPGSIAGC